MIRVWFPKYPFSWKEDAVMSVSITKIQLRRGPATDLPGIPISMAPLEFTAGLDEGELGYTTNNGRLFVGMGTTSPVLGMPNYNRTAFPYQNIEVLTENSPPNVFSNAISDNQTGYIQSVILASTTSFLNLQMINPSTGLAQDFLIDVSGVGAGANVDYFMFDTSNNPIRQGRLTILWNSLMVGTPLCSDEAQCLISVYNNIQWRATLLGTGGNQHVVLQYINLTSDTPTVYFRIDRFHP
jgi:hypothetical protein